jgi:predicted DNA-binding transcriptional regulator YafY
MSEPDYYAIGRAQFGKLAHANAARSREREERLAVVRRVLEEQPDITAPELRERLSIGLRTAQRDLKACRATRAHVARE